MGESYYIQIDGKKYDRGLVEAAREAVEGAGDGRISRDDAQKLLEQVKDGNTYTDIEKDTVRYIREHFTWTDAADEWFRTEVRRWAATSTNTSKATESTASASQAGLVNRLSPSLNGKQRQHLRQLGHHIQPVVLVGQRSIEVDGDKQHLKETLIDNVQQALLSHELIKIKVHDSDDLPFVASEVHRVTGAQLAQKIGKNLLFYKRHPEKPKIVLPK